MMKNLFKTTFYICVFAFAGILFQISCSNSDRESNSPNAVGKILYSQYDATNAYSIWYSNIDGTNATQIPINLPANVTFMNANSNAYVRFTPDGQKVLFVAVDYSGTVGINRVYSCNLDGTNLQPVLSPPNATVLLIGDVK